MEGKWVTSIANCTKVVSPFKDVEGLHFKFHYNLYHKSVVLYHIQKQCLTVEVLA